MLGQGDQHGGCLYLGSIKLVLYHMYVPISVTRISHQSGWMVAEKEKGSSTFGDHLGREHFKHHLDEHLGEGLGDHLGLQPLQDFQQDALPAPHLDLTLVRLKRSKTGRLSTLPFL